MDTERTKGRGEEREIRKEEMLTTQRLAHIHSSVNEMCKVTVWSVTRTEREFSGRLVKEALSELTGALQGKFSFTAV